MREGGQESFTRYLYNSDLNYAQKAIGGGYIIIPLIFTGSSSFLTPMRGSTIQCRASAAPTEFQNA